MELKSLLLGLAFSLGIFAVKSGTGLAALSQGDLTHLSGDLVLAFTTTVAGMTLGLVSYFFFTVQRRWPEEDVKNMELAAAIIMGDYEKKLDKAG